MARTHTVAASDDGSASIRTDETSCSQLAEGSVAAAKRIDGDEPTSTTDFSQCSDYSESNDSWVVSQKAPVVSGKKVKKEKKLEKKKSRRGLLDRIPSAKGALMVSSPSSPSKKSKDTSLSSKSDHVSPSHSGGSRRRPLLRSLSAKKLLGLGSSEFQKESKSTSKKSKKDSKKDSKKKRKDSGLSKSDHGASSLVDAIATSRSSAWKEKVRPVVQHGEEALESEQSKQVNATGSPQQKSRSRPRRYKSFGEEEDDEDEDHETLYLPKNALISDCLKAYDRILNDYDDSTRKKRTSAPSPKSLLEAPLDDYNNILREFRDSTVFDSTRLSEGIIQEAQAAPSSTHSRKMAPRDEGSSKMSNPLLESAFDDYTNILRDFRDSTMLMSEDVLEQIEGDTTFAESPFRRSATSRMASKTGGSNWEV